MTWLGGTAETWLTLLVCVSVAVWPLIGAAGLAIGRMQAEDEAKAKR